MLTLLGMLSANATTNPVVFVSWPAAVNTLENTATNFAITVNAQDVRSGQVNNQNNPPLVITTTVSPAVGAIQKITPSIWSYATDALFGSSTYSSTLSIVPVANYAGSATITVTVLVKATGQTATALIPVTIVPVNQAPSFTFLTNTVLVSENTNSVKVLKFLANMSPGPATWEKAQVYDFTVTETSGGVNNVLMNSAPQVDASGTLYFIPKPGSYGTNVVTVVMTDNGGVANNGVDSYTNSFTIGVAQSDIAPVIDIVNLNNRGIPENESTNFLVYVSSATTTWDKLSLFPTAANKNVSVTIGTSSNAVPPPSELASAANVAAFPVTVTAGAVVGSTIVTLVASDRILSSAAQTFTATVQAANQAPSFVLSSPLVVTTENHGMVTNKSFLKNISVGPASQSKQTFGFVCTSSSPYNNVLTNIAAPYVTGTNSGTATWATNYPTVTIDNSGTLMFMPWTNSYGSTVVTVTMTNSGSALFGGVTSYTTNFTIQVTPVSTAPTNTTGLLNIAASDVSVFEGSSTNFAIIPVYGLNGEANFTLTLLSNAVQNSYIPGLGIAGMALTNVSGVTAYTNELVSQCDPTFGTNAVNFMVYFYPTPGTNFGGKTCFDNPGTVQFALMANDGTTGTPGTNRALATINFTVLPINDAPAFTLPSHVVTKSQNQGTVTNAAFATGLKATGNGYLDDGTNTFGFFLYPSAYYTNGPGVTNVSPLMTFTNLAIDTNGNLVITTPVTPAYGTNLITVVMTNSGGTANGAINSTTNYFWLSVVPDAPELSFNGLNANNAIIVAENAGQVTNAILLSTDIKVSVFGTSFLHTNFTLTPFSDYTNVSPAGVLSDTLMTFTNLSLDTGGNLSFFTPPNVYGTNRMQLVISADNQSGFTNSFTTNFIVGIAKDTPSITWDPTKLTNYNTLVVPENGGGVSYSFVDAFSAGTHKGIMASLLKPTASSQGTNFTCTASQTYYIADAQHPLGNPSLAVSDIALGITNLQMDLSGLLTFTTPPNTFGTNLVTVVMMVTNNGGVTSSFTTTFVLGIQAEDTPPTFAMSTTNYTVTQYSVPLTIPRLVTGITSEGLGAWESTQTVSFATPSTTHGSYYITTPTLVPNGTNNQYDLQFVASGAGAGHTDLVSIQASDNGGNIAGTFDLSNKVQYIWITFPASNYVNAAGSYSGLYYSTPDVGPPTPQSAGYVSLTLKGDGSFTGYLLSTASITGQTDTTNAWYFTNAFDSLYPNTLETFRSGTNAPTNYFLLNLAMDSLSMSITGTVQNTHPGIDFPPVNLRAYKNIAASATNYNIVVLGSTLATNSGPVGDSFIGLSVVGGGAVALSTNSGLLADGSAITNLAATSMCVNGYYPLYAIPTNGIGASLYGMLQFYTNSEGVVQLSPDTNNSSVYWFGPANPTPANVYTNGFTNQTVALGSAYATNGNISAMISYTNAWVIMGDVFSTNATWLPTPYAFEIQIPSSGAPPLVTVPVDVNHALVSVSIDENTGLITGWFKNGWATVPAAKVNIYGMIVPGENMGAGFFLDNGVSGEFLLIGTGR